MSQSNAPDQIATTCTQKNCYKHFIISYSEARKELFGYLHLQVENKNYSLKDVYCNKTYTEKDFSPNKGLGPLKIPDPNLLNAEHTWPQSHFSKQFPKAIQKSDLHILFPVSSSENSLRSNLDFNDVVTVTHKGCSASKKGKASSKDNTIYFEPPDEHKGNVARAIFYFAVHYKLPVSDKQEAALRRWNKLDPVDEQEKLRNDEVFKIQGDRNPFIDFPQFVELIDNF